MEDINNNDDFSFDNFISDESAKELGVTKDSTAVEPVATEQPKVEKPADKSDVPTNEPTEQKTVEPVIVNEKPDVSTTQDSQQTGPVRAPNEPEWRYEYRKEIWDKQQELKNSSNDSDKSALKSEIEQLRKDLASFAKTKEAEVDTFDDTEDVPSGYIKREDIEKILEERERTAKIDALEAAFLSSKPNLKDKQSQDLFFSYVGQTYNLVGKNEKQMLALLNMAYDDLFPDTTSNKIEDAKKLEKTLDIVDFSGSQTPERTNPEKDEDKKLVENIKNSSGNDFSWIL